MKSNENSMYQILKQSMSMREQPLLIMITTQGFVRDGMLDEFYELAKDVIYNPESQNERFIAFVYEQDSKEEINDENMWIKSNPSIDVIKSREDLREKVAMAKTNSSLMASLLVKDFDIVQNGSQLFLTWEEVNIDDKDLLVHKLSTNLYDTYCTLGFDLSASGTDASAATINIKKDGSLEMIEISNGNKLTYVDKKILDIFECQKFYFNDVNSPVTCYDDDNEYLGIILPIAVKGNK